MTWHLRALGKHRLRAISMEPSLATGTAIAPPGEASLAPTTQEPAADQVRRELARELHDQVVPELTATLVEVENFKSRPFDEQAAVQQFGLVQDSLRRTLSELRQMLYDLRDEEAWHGSLTSSLRDFACRFQERTGVTVEIVVSKDWPRSIRSAAAQHLTRIVREAVTNARLHGGARLVKVSLGMAGKDRAAITITDDGSGFAPDSEAGHGVLGMRERALLLGGSLAIESQPGNGARVMLAVPVRTIA